MEVYERPSQIANYLYHCSDEEFAEVFALYYHMHFNDIPSSHVYVEDADDVVLDKKAMQIDVDKLSEHLRYTLDEIIYDEDIDASAWWKGETA